MVNVNTVLNCDCLGEGGMPLIPDKSIDMILCDLPYGSTACSWDTILPFDKLWEQYNRIIKDNGAIVLTASQPFTSALVMSNPKMFKYEWIWYKNMTSGFALVKKQPLRNHENILIFYKKQCTYNPIKEERDMSVKSKSRMKYKFTTESGINEQQNGIKKIQYIPEDENMSYPKSVKKFNGVNSHHRFHPTQKPVALFEYLIKTYTNEGDVVLDNCAGSGTTAIACLNTKRNYILMEKEQKYYDIINDRIKQHTQLTVNTTNNFF